MNDAYLGGSDSSGGDGGDGLSALGKELQTAATKAWIEEQERVHRLYFTETTAQASSDAANNAKGEALYIDQSADGVFYVKNKADEDHPDRYKYAFYPQDSEAWKKVHEKFAELREGIERIAGYKPSGVSDGVVTLESMTSDLEMETFKVEGEELENLVESNLDSESGSKEFYKGLFPAESDWMPINGVIESLSSWDGMAAEAFRLGYAERLPSILIGQLAIVLTLKGALEVERTTLAAAKQDATELAKAYIDAFEAGKYFDLDWDKVLTIVENIGSFAEHGSKIPQKHAKLVGQIGTYVKDGAGFARSVAEMCGAELKQKEPEVSVSAEGVEALADECMAEIGNIENTVCEVEDAGAEVINGFLEVVRSTEIGEEREGKWVLIPLTIRQMFFEPGISDADGNGLDKIGANASDDDPSNDPTYDSFRDSSVMGPAPEDGARFAADLTQLYRTGDKTLPQIADNYGGLANSLNFAGPDIVKDGFERELPDGAGTGSLYPAWCELYDELAGIFTHSETTLNLVGNTIAAAAQAYGEQDDAAAAEIIATKGELPWQ